MSKTPASSKTLAAKVRPFTNNAQKEALSAYGAALEAMQAGQFDKALEGFRSIEEHAPMEVRERARVYAQGCQRQIEMRRTQLEFSSSAERYDYAMACVNGGDFEEAREHLEAILGSDESADFAHYGLAMLNGMTGQAEECLHHLGRAIELNTHNRILARSDVDFRQMADDPRFTELLYPEAIESL
jgi:tetratricopeptide (TPR) repeat protein